VEVSVVGVAGMPARTAPLLVQYGWLPLPEATETRVVPPTTATDGGTIKIEFPSAPCGPMWLRAGIDKDGSGKWKPADGTCEGAGPGGRLLIQRATESGAETCALRVPE